MVTCLAGTARLVAGAAQGLWRDLCDECRTCRHDPHELCSATHHCCDSSRALVFYAAWFDLVLEGLYVPGE